MIASIIIAIVALWVLWSFASLFKNIQKAKSTQLPIVISLFNQQNPLWMLTQGPLMSILDKLSIDLGSFMKCSRRNWTFNDRYLMHQKYGKMFVHVTPSDIEFYVADAAVSDEIFSRKRDFPKPSKMIGNCSTSSLFLFSSILSSSAWSGPYNLQMSSIFSGQVLHQ